MRRLILLSFLAFPAYAVDERPPVVTDTEIVEPVPAVQSGKTLDPDKSVGVKEHTGKEYSDNDVPEPVLPVQSGETLEPDITIIRKGKKTIQEYRRDGRLFMIKVIPDVGPPYFFIDSNGDGKLDIRRSDMSQDANVNMWKILEWD